MVGPGQSLAREGPMGFLTQTICTALRRDDAGGDARTKDITWGDFLLALLLSPLLVVPPVVLVYVLLSGPLDVSGDALSLWMRVAFAAICLAEGLALAAFYERKGYEVEYKWAWVLVAVVIAALPIGLHLTGTTAVGTTLELAAYFYGSLLAYFVLIMLSLVMSVRQKYPERLEKSKVDVQREAVTVLLKW